MDIEYLIVIIVVVMRMICTCNKCDLNGCSYKRVLEVLPCTNRDDGSFT